MDSKHEADSSNETEPNPIPESVGPGTDAPPGVGERPIFHHPQWMVGVVLIFAVIAIVAGLRNPVWWLIGSPCILVLAVWIYVKIKAP
jgi:hypothetical protein